LINFVGVSVRCFDAGVPVSLSGFTFNPPIYPVRRFAGVSIYGRSAEFSLENERISYDVDENKGRLK
jgi:hypothetical protein